MTQNETTVVEIVRLRADLYMQLEKQFSRPIVTDATTPIGVAYALGVEAVLKAIRNNIVLPS